MRPTAATLTGHAANPDAVAANVYFEYGTTTAYGKQTSTQPLAAMTGSTGFTAPVSGLAPSTIYHFRVVAVNPDGMSVGTDQTFMTGPPPPVLSKLKIKPKSFRVGTPGATISYRDSQPSSTTTFTVLKAMLGYRVGGGCVAHRGKARHAKYCTRYVRAGTFTHADGAGANHLHFTGRIHGHRLSPGRYKLQAVARNAIAELSAALTATFRIVP